MDNSTRKAIGLAFEAGHGDRLMEIAKEHIQLARLALNCRADVGRAAIDAAIDARIDALRKERDAIIAKFEEVSSDA